jgi:heme exporter protein C
MRRTLLLLAFVMLLASMWIALTLGRIAGPPANPDSVVRNIFYAHVPYSICALLCFVVLLVASIGYLVTSRPGWDLVATAAAEVGTVFATIMNATGMIFSRAEWNIWWTPSPRLVSAAILWFLYVVYWGGYARSLES